MTNLNIFTCCNEKYADFIPTFILSNLYHVDDSFVEVCLDSSTTNAETFIPKCLYEFYPERFLVRNIDSKGIGALGTVRFFTTPIVKTEWVYISDVDIINMTTDIVGVHKKIMSDANIPYSNMIRENSLRLTGLHFTHWDNYYPIQNYSDIASYAKQDEEFLYQLMAKRFPNVDNKNKVRPVHGIHASPNRDPYSTKIDWGVLGIWKDKWETFSNSYEFKVLYQSLSDRLKYVVDVINKKYEI